MTRFAIVLVCLLGCASQKPPARPALKCATLDDVTPDTAEQFSAVVNAAYQEHFTFRPAAAVDLGIHDYDGKLPDHSPTAIRAEIARLEGVKKALEGFSRSRLADADWLDREVFLNEVKSELFDLKTLDVPFQQPLFYTSAVNIADYVIRDYAPKEQRIQALSQLCAGLSAYLATARKNLKPPFPRTWIDVTLIQNRGLIDFLKKDVKAAFTGVAAADARVLNQAVASCSSAIEEHVAYLEAEKKRATTSYALGPEKFLQMLADKEGITLDLATLKRMGVEDMERNTRLMTAAAGKLSRQPTAQAVAKILDDKPTFAESLALATKQGNDLRAFLIDKEVVSIPFDDPAEVRETPSFMRYNSAFLNAPGPFEPGSQKSFYYISPPDPTWTAKEQRGYLNAPGQLMATTIHELWPGHFLHYLHKKKNPSKIVKSFCTYSMSEGWAHYAEELLWDLGAMGDSPAMHVGQLSDALLRNVRYLSAIGLHTEGMTVTESERMFRDQAFSDGGNARQQAARGTFDPGYLNYTLGKLLIKQLKEDVRKKVGDDFSEKAFHDTFLSFGCAPIPVIRTFMLGD
jgi:uncharacterized protein (DUF885 family)